jgi:hypothetical protein
MATDAAIPESVRLAAIRDALDRGGLGAKQAMEVEITAKPYELVFNAIESGGSRAEFRGKPELLPRALPKSVDDFVTDSDTDDFTIEAEVIEDDDESAVNPLGGTLGPPPPPRMQTLEDAVAAQRAAQRSARLTPIRRALPRQYVTRRS